MKTKLPEGNVYLWCNKWSNRCGRHFKYFLLIVLTIAVCLSGIACNFGAREEETEEEIREEVGEEIENPLVTIEMKNGNIIKVELKPLYAPNTVSNFIYLVEQGFYDGLIFHRVIPGFMVQGGCPEGTGVGGPGHSIKGEFAANDHENDLKHQRGVLSMARSAHPDSAGSQFFIMVKDAPHLDGDYAAFGQVIEGMEEVDRIVAVSRDQRDRPHEAQIMKKVTVETFGHEHAPVEKFRR